MAILIQNLWTHEEEDNMWIFLNIIILLLSTKFHKKSPQTYTSQLAVSHSIIHSHTMLPHRATPHCWCRERIIQIPFRPWAATNKWLWRRRRDALCPIPRAEYIVLPVVTLSNTDSTISRKITVIVPLATTTDRRHSVIICLLNTHLPGILRGWRLWAVCLQSKILKKYFLFEIFIFFIYFP